jgi:hypothetical protein
MVVATVAAVGIVIASGGLAAPAVAAAAAEGVVAGGVGAGAAITGAASTGAAVAGSAGIGASAGAITGAVATGTATGASVGAAVGTAAGTAVSASGGGAAALAGGLALGPVGWLALGATSEEPTPARYTYDCWKPVLHDISCEPSNGKLLRDVAMDERIKHVIVSTTNGRTRSLPDIILENIWDERFHIEYVTLLPTNEIAAHAVRLA